MSTQRRVVWAIAFSQLINYTLPLITFPLLVKSLTITEYGMWVEAGTVAGLLSAFVMSGLLASIVVLAVGSPSRANEYFCHALFIYSGVAGLLSFLMIVLAPALNTLVIRQPAGVLLLQITSASIISVAFGDLAAEIFRLRNQGIRAAMFSVALAVARLSTAGFAAWRHDLMLFAWAYVISQLLLTAVQIGVAYRGIRVVRPSLTTTRKIFRNALTLAIVPQANWLVTYGDRLMLSIFSTTSAVAVYSASYQITGILIVTGAPFLFTLLPTVGHRWAARDVEGVQESIRHATRSIFILLIPAIAGLALIGEPLLHLLATSDFVQGWLLILMLAVGIGFSVINTSLHFIFYAQERAQVLRRIYWQAACLNIIANLIAIPLFSYMGAGFTTVFTFGFIFWRLWRETNMRFDSLFDRNTIWRCMLASLLMGVWVLPIVAPTIPRLAVAVLGGAVVYGLSLLWLRVLTLPELIAPFRTIMRRR